MELHAGQIQGFFDVPFDHLFSAPMLVKYLQEKLAEFKTEYVLDQLRISI